MASRRELIEAEDFQRRRGVAALSRADTLAVEDVPRRPNAALLAGLVLVVLLAAGSAAGAFLTDRAPDGWSADGTLVVDEDTGARFLALDGALRPTPSLTAALLAGARPEPVLVPHARVLSAPAGLPLDGAGLPESPPALAAAQPPLTACAEPGAVDVFAGPIAGTPSAAGGLLVRTPADPTTVLVTGGRTHRVDPAALIAFGWSPVQVREVPAAWLALLPGGGDLAPLPAPGPVVRTASGRAFVLADGRARPVTDPTSTLLLPRVTRTVPDADVTALPVGVPIGLRDVPSEPPVVPAREDGAVGCVVGGGTDAPHLVVADAAADSPATRAAPVRVLADDAGTVRVTWHVAPGGGALLAPPEFDVARPAAQADRRDEGMVLVAGGVGFPVADTRALQALGYARDRVLLVDRPWFALLAQGPGLAAAS